MVLSILIYSARETRNPKHAACVCLAGAKDYWAGWSSPTDSQWSFSSVDLEFRLLIYDKNCEQYIFLACAFTLVTDLSMFWKVNSCVKTYEASWSVFTVVYKKFKPCVFFQCCRNKKYKLFVFFQCCRNMKYSRYQDSFFVHSWFDNLFILLVVEESVAYGRIHNLSLFWQRFWKHMHTGFSNLICCLSGHFLQVRLIIQHWFFLSGLICLWFRALLFPVTYGSTNTQEKLTRTNKQKNL